MTVVNRKKLYEHLTQWLKNYISNMAGQQSLILHLDDNLASIATLIVANDAHHSGHITVITNNTIIRDFANTIGITIINPVSWKPNGDAQLILGNKTRNECELIRAYHKYNDRYDISVIQDIFDSELLDLFNYRAGLSNSFASFKMRPAGWPGLDHQIKKIKGLPSNEIEWVDRLDQTENIIRSQDDSAKHPAWHRLSANQRKIVAKIHQIEKLTKHKEFSHIYYPKVRNNNSLVR